MKYLVIEPSSKDEKVLVQFSEKFVMDKHVSVKVPKGYQGIVFFDEKPAARIPSTMEKKLVDLGKQFIGKTGRVAFVRGSVTPDMAWGFGNIRVNNERLSEAYTVGANGKYSVGVKEAGKLLGSVSGDENVTTDLIREKTISIIKNVGTAVVAKHFTNSSTSIFEISAHLIEIRKEIIDALSGETAFDDLGLKLHDLTVDGIHIPDEDLELIRSRLNALTVEATDEVAQTVKETSPAPQNDEALFKILEKLKNLDEALQKVGEKQIEKDTPDLSELSAQMEKVFDERLAENSAEMRLKLEESISDRVSKEVEAWKDTMLAGIDEKLQGISHRLEEKDEDEGYDVRSLIEKAKKEDDYVIPASIIYTNVERNLIETYGLEHRDKRFVMPYAEFIQLADTAKIAGSYVLKRPAHGGFEPIPVNVVERFKDGSPKTVEMYPLVRYLKAGLSPEDAKKAERIGVVINRLRHQSPENARYLQVFFAQSKQTKKAFLLEAIEFLEDKKLYIER